MQAHLTDTLPRAPGVGLEPLGLGSTPVLPVPLRDLRCSQIPPVRADWYTEWYTRRTWASNVLMSGTRVFDGGVHLSPQRLVAIAKYQVSESLNGKAGDHYSDSFQLF